MKFMKPKYFAMLIGMIVTMLTMSSCTMAASYTKTPEEVNEFYARL